MSDTVKTDLIDSVEDSNSTTTTTNSTVTNTGTTVTKNSNTDSTTVDGEKKSVLKDYYAVLGVAAKATEKQIEQAYKKLSLKFHPDRNQGDEVAANKFKEVEEANDVLSDPTKRKAYDASDLDKVAPHEVDGVDVSTLGGLGRVFGAVISRFGVPVSTQINADLVEEAQAIAKGGSLDGQGPPMDGRVSDLVWGWAMDGKVERQSVVYYRLSVDTRQIENGFVIACKSTNKGKFKILLFNSAGVVVHQEESKELKSKEKFPVQASLYYTKFDTYQLGEPSSATVPTDKDIPPILQRLELLTPSKKTLAAGKYLICIYGDNFIGRTNFNLIAVPAKNDAPEVTEMEETDEALLDSKNSLQSLKAEYTQAKAAYENALAKLKNEGEKVDLLIQAKEKSYSGFLLSSIAAFAPLNAPAPIDHEIEGNKKESADSADTASRARKPSFPGIPIPPPAIGAAATNAYNSAAVAANTAATTAKEYSANAAAHAATVTGWINKRFSGFQTMMKPEEKAEDLEVGTAETAETLVESADDSKVSSTSATDASVPPSTEVIADTNTNTESEEATADDPRGSSFDTVPDESNTTTTEK